MQALISVSNKVGVIEFAKALTDFEVLIISTGGTAKTLREAGISVEEVSGYTGFPEIMDGRVKTLHPRIHGGILGRTGIDDDVMADHGIRPIGLVVVNLYPFEAAIANEGCTDEEAIENIDIGGPAMLRSAAKNHARVTVVVDPNDYNRVLAEMQASSDRETTPELRRTLAGKAFRHTASYDRAIAAYFAKS